MTTGRLQGKVAVVTGIASGIGQGVALMFARQGARVLGCDLDVEGAQATVAQARAEGLALDSLHPLDLLAEGGAERLMTAAVERHGGLDILVNAAAIGVFKMLPEMTYADWRRTMTGELDIVFLACKAAWPHLVARGGGAIVNFASANAHEVIQHSGALAHCAGKGGVLAMTRQLAMEGGPHGIRANTISPGMIRTGATRPVLENQAYLAEVLRKKMVGRVGEPQDIAWCATYLASDEAGFVTAADFRVDGGATAW